MKNEVKNIYDGATRQAKHALAGACLAVFGAGSAPDDIPLTANENTGCFVSPVGFVLAGRCGLSPEDTAEKLAKHIPPEVFAGVCRPVGGSVFFTPADAWYIQLAGAMLAGGYPPLAPGMRQLSGQNRPAYEEYWTRAGMFVRGCAAEGFFNPSCGDSGCDSAIALNLPEKQVVLAGALFCTAHTPTQAYFWLDKLCEAFFHLYDSCRLWHPCAQKRLFRANLATIFYTQLGRVLDKAEIIL